MDAFACYGSDSEDETEQTALTDQNSPLPQAKRQRIDQGNLPTQASTNAGSACSDDALPANIKLPPVPPELHQMFSAPPLANDQKISARDEKPSKKEEKDHGGRIRSFPHVDGDFATVVYVRVALPDKSRGNLDTILQKVRERALDLQPLPTAADPAPAPCARKALSASDFHLSLSRTVAIRSHQIEALISALQRNLRRTKRFTVELERVAVFVNDEKTRTFLALETTAKCTPAICQLIQRVDSVFVSSFLEPFYQNPRPHVSVGWMLGDRHEELAGATQQALPSNGRAGAGMGGLGGAPWAAPVAHVECKVGNKAYSIWTGH